MASDMVPLRPHNLFSELPPSLDKEVFESLLENEHFKLERIVSYGQATPAGDWYDQEKCEWVVLLKGRAAILFEGDEKAHTLEPGDCLNIPAHCRHRVEWTEADTETVWLALHY